MKGPGFNLKPLIMITKNKNDLELNKKGQEIDANTDMTEILDLFDKDFKVAILKMLRSAVMNTLETYFKK